MKKIAKILAIAVVAILLASCNSPVKVLEKGIKDAKAATTMEELEKVNEQVAEKMKKFDEAELKNDTAVQNRTIEYSFVCLQKSMELGGFNFGDFSIVGAEDAADRIKDAEDAADMMEDAVDDFEDALDAD